MSDRSSHICSDGKNAASNGGSDYDGNQTESAQLLLRIVHFIFPPENLLTNAISVIMTVKLKNIRL